MIGDVEDLATDVATEYHKLNKDRRSLLKMSDDRLKKVKQSNEQIKQSKCDIKSLRESIDSVHDDYSQELADERAKCFSVTSKLNETESKLDQVEQYAADLECEIIEAREEIDVSSCIDCHSTFTCFS